jgi:hypothetical protein
MDVDTSDSAGRCLTAVGRGTRPEVSVLVLQSDCGETISRDRSTLSQVFWKMGKAPRLKAQKGSHWRCWRLGGPRGCADKRKRVEVFLAVIFER